MNIQRFHAPTAREALAKARLAFGDGTLILSNRQTPLGIEVVATTEASLAELDQDAPNLAGMSAHSSSAPASASAPAPRAHCPRCSEWRTSTGCSPRSMRASRGSLSVSSSRLTGPEMKVPRPTSPTTSPRRSSSV